MKENPKHTDHHFTKMSEYKYNLIEVEPRKTDLEKILIYANQRYDKVESYLNESVEKQLKDTIHFNQGELHELRCLIGLIEHMR